MKGEINSRQDKFITNILEGMTLTEAYIQAGYSKKNARQAASNLFTNVYIQVEYKRRREETIEQARAILEKASINAANKVVELVQVGDKDSYCNLYAAKDILDRVGLKPVEKIEHSGEMSIEHIWERIIKPTDDSIR